MPRTTNDSRGILVAGDSTVDWIIAEPSGRSDSTIDTRYAWTLKAGPGISAVLGGAALDTRILAAASARSGESILVTGPSIPEEILNNPSSTSITRTFASWSPHPVETGSKQTAWRMNRFIGVHPPRDFPSELYAREANSEPACIVIEDGSLRLRIDESLWPKAAIESDAQIVIRQIGSLGTGALWDYLMANAADRTTMLCHVGDLRKEGAAIGQPLSWERTAQDVVDAVHARPDLAAAKRVVVGLAASGAVIVERDCDAELIFDPRTQEGDWEQSRPGHSHGSNTMVLAALAWEFAKAGAEADVREAVISGIETARVLHTVGYQIASNENGVKIGFPIDRIADSIVEGQDVDSDIQCVKISADPDWRIFDSTSAGNFRQAAEQIAIFGVNRVGKEIPLESMGYWSSVDRIEIESMRSLRNIITEYLASPGRQRPLNLAVFGPPGSGKSFAIKQMASVINPHRDRLGSLEFNLSQFQSAAQLPAAMQQIRDLRLREYLPLVFWDEFDSALEGNELGWLVSFLAPMQDGAFVQEGIIRPIGPAIFIFAGGTHSTMDSFKNRAIELPGAKATDFLSRLRGFVNVLGPNPDSADDRTFPLRRAILLRAVLQRQAAQIFEGEDMRIDRSLLNAFLDVPAYLHGSRSMEAIIEMSAISNKLKFERSALPAVHQLALHVDADAFMAIVERGADADA